MREPSQWIQGKGVGDVGKEIIVIPIQTSTNMDIYRSQSQARLLKVQYHAMLLLDEEEHPGRSRVVDMPKDLVDDRFEEIK